MRWFKQHSTLEPSVPAFTRCAGCSYDFVTGDGARNCHWGECPYLPEQYKVFCPSCNYNFATREGQHRCEDLKTCSWAAEGFAHARLAKARFGPRTSAT